MVLGVEPTTMVFQLPGSTTWATKDHKIIHTYIRCVVCVCNHASRLVCGGMAGWMDTEGNYWILFYLNYKTYALNTNLLELATYHKVIIRGREMCCVAHIGLALADASVKWSESMHGCVQCVGLWTNVCERERARKLLFKKKKHCGTAVSVERIERNCEWHWLTALSVTEWGQIQEHNQRQHNVFISEIQENLHMPAQHRCSIGTQWGSVGDVLSVCMGMWI